MVLAYCLRASIEDGGAVEVLVVFDGVAVLDDAFGAAVGWRSAVLRHVNTFPTVLYRHRILV